ncbi:MAG: hypothetical protein ACM3XM_12920 [Mycobacterium leprae]
MKGGRKVEWLTLRLHDCVTRNADGTFAIDKTKAARVLVADLTRSVEWVNEGIRSGLLLTQADLGVAFNDTQTRTVCDEVARLTTDGPNAYQIWFCPAACSLIAAMLHKGQSAADLTKQLRAWLRPKAPAGRVMPKVAQCLMQQGEELFSSYAAQGGVSLVFRWPATLVEILD